MEVLVILASIATFFFLPQVLEFLSGILDFTGLMLGVMFYVGMLTLIFKQFDRIHWKKQERQAKMEKICPSCKKADALVWAATEHTSTEQYTVEKYSKDYDTDGNVIGASPSGSYETWERTKEANIHQCKYCGHTERKYVESKRKVHS